MKGRNAYKIWAPAASIWSGWVRPVCFAAIDATNSESRLVTDLTVPRILYIEESAANTAVIVDLPDKYGVEEGLALAKLGFRPIPVYNGTAPQHGARAIVGNSRIETALLYGANEIAKIMIPSNAPPAFLLDSNRSYKRKTSEPIFDNGWDLYGQDLPSAHFFLEHGITQIIVRSRSIQKDLSVILYNFAKKGIKIFFTEGYLKAKEVPVKKPPKKVMNLFG